MTEYDPDFGKLEMEASLQRVGLAMRVLDAELENLRKFRATVSMAHTVGGFIDPTAYRDALWRGDMDAMAELAAELDKPILVWRDRIKPKLPQEQGAVA